MPTIFTKILNKEIPADIVYEDEHCIAIKDINPQAPHHYLVIPREPIVNLNDTLDRDDDPTATLLKAAAKVADKQGLKEQGYRVVINNGEGAGQEVMHLHLHILSGRSFNWPPG